MSKEVKCRSVKMISLSFEVTTTMDFQGTDIRAECLKALQRLGDFLRRKDDDDEMNSLELDVYSKNGVSRSNKTDMKLLTDSTASKSEKCSTGSCSRKGKEFVQFIDIQSLSERLEAVEEETRVMKRELDKAMEERKKLVSELYQQFLVIDRRLHLGNRSADGSFIAELPKEERRHDSGLLEVLNRDSSP